MTFDEVYQFLWSVNRKSAFRLMSETTIEVTSASGRITRHEQFDERLTEAINQHINQPNRIVVMKNSSYDGNHDPVGLKCYMYETSGTDIYVGRLYNDHSRIYYLSKGYYRLQGRYHSIDGAANNQEERGLLQNAMEWVAKESSIYRLPLLTGTLTFNRRG